MCSSWPCCELLTSAPPQHHTCFMARSPSKNSCFHVAGEERGSSGGRSWPQATLPRSRCDCGQSPAAPGGFLPPMSLGPSESPAHLLCLCLPLSLSAGLCLSASRSLSLRESLCLWLIYFLITTIMRKSPFGPSWEGRQKEGSPGKRGRDHLPSRS